MCWLSLSFFPPPPTPFPKLHALFFKIHWPLGWCYWVLVCRVFPCYMGSFLVHTSRNLTLSPPTAFSHQWLFSVDWDVRESFLICACISAGLVLHRTRDAALANVNACVQWPCHAWKTLFHNGHLLALKIFPLLKRERRLGGRGCAIGIPFKTECSTFSLFWSVARLWIYSRLVQKEASLLGMKVHSSIKTSRRKFNTMST